MFDLIVGKNVAYKAKTGGGTIADYTEIPLLAPGAMALFTEDNRLIETTVVAADLVGVKGFYVAVGRTNDQQVSNLIDRDAFHRVKCAYVAPVLQVTSVSALGLPVTYISGEEGELLINYHVPGREPAIMPERFSVSTKASDTNTTYVQRIVDKINNNSTHFTAVMVGAGVSITITAVDKNTRFDVAVRGVLEDATVTITTPAVYSVGDADDMLVAQKESGIYDGNTSPLYLSDKFYSVPSEIVADAQYIQYDIVWKTEARDSNFVRNVATPGVKIIAPTGTAIITALDAIFAVLLSAMPSTGAGNSPFAAIV